MTQSRRIKRRRGNTALFGRLLGCLMAAGILSASGAAVDGAASTQATPWASGERAGRLLVASPRMRDPRFAKTVVFLLQHDDRGAKGLIVNRLISVQPATKLLEHLRGEGTSGDGGREVRIHYGGPVRTTRWIFIHSNDYAGRGTTAVTDQVSLTSNPEILRALANGKGPAKGFLAVGYAGWGPGQLENEIRRKDWVTLSPDDKLVLDDDLPTKWQRAMDKRVVDL